LMVAGLVAMVSGREGYVALFPGQVASEFRSHFEYEVAIRSADAIEGGEELLIPHADLKVLEVGLDGAPADSTLAGSVWRYLRTGVWSRRESQRFESAELPFSLELSRFVPNGGIAPLNAASATSLPVVDGLTVLPRPKQTEAELNTPAVYARALAPDGSLVGETILAETAIRPWAVAVGDSVYAVSLRPRRFAMPFTVRLEEFFKDEHPRTDMASVYRSDVTAMRGDGREERVRIEMNQPLRENGFVMFQASFTEFPGEDGPRYRSQFAVVRNPADKWPEIACWVIGSGLVLAFGMRLIAFLGKQQRARSAEASA
ncbi:MAG: cytochrome c biogenesis protein ResB, partial [Planctomycetota bacterium]